MTVLSSRCLNVSRQDLVSFYQHSWALVYPSLYEGFGLPILEAFRSKTLLMTSSTSSLTEVAGKHAVYTEPDFIDSLKKGLLQLIYISVEERKNMTEQAFKYSQKFSYSKSASSIMQHWRQATNHD